MAGRDIDARDAAAAPGVAVVHNAFVARYYTIVGVAADAHTHGLRRAVEPRFFVPTEQRTSPSGTRTHIARLTAEEHALAQLATVFGFVAVMLSSLGLYGVLAFAVARRTQEIAARLALGAESRGVIRLIVSENLVLLAVATGAGSLLAASGGRVLRAQSHGVTAGDPATLAGAAGVLLAVALIAIYLPARRASRIEPMAAALRRV